MRFLAFTLLSATLGACGLSVVGIDPLSTATDGGPLAEASATSDVNQPIEGGATPPDAAAGAIDGGLLTLTVQPGPAGVTIRSKQGDITCAIGQDACAVTRRVGNPVTLTATTGNEQTLVGWSEPGCGREPSCTFTMDASRTVSVTVVSHVNYMHTNTTLFSIANGGATTQLTTLKSCEGTPVDLAIDRKQSAYLVGLGPNALYKLDTATGTCSKVGDTKLGNTSIPINGLSFAPDPQDPKSDALYGSDQNAALLYRLSLSDGQLTQVVDMGTGNVARGDLAYLPGRGFYVTLKSAAGNDRLAIVDLAASSLKVIGVLPYSDVTALGWRGDRLIGYNASRYFLIDPADATATDLTTAGIVSAYGAASGP